MSDTYTKLFSSITASTVWSEPPSTRLVWITMLAMADQHGRVWASVPGLARIANVPLDDTVRALETLSGPDQWSRTPDNEGRRIAAIDGGWQLLNHAKYRAVRSADERREYWRQWKADKRAAERSNECPQVSTKSTGSTPPTPTPAPYKEHVPNGTCPISAEIEPEPVAEGEKPKRQPVPFAAIVAAYHEILPELPRCEVLTKAREGALRQRWGEHMPALDDWRNFFTHVRGSPFLMGRAPPQAGKPPFRADLEWLTKAANFAKIAEGKYHR